MSTENQAFWNKIANRSTDIQQQFWYGALNLHNIFRIAQLTILHIENMTQVNQIRIYRGGKKYSFIKVKLRLTRV